MNNERKIQFEYFINLGFILYFILLFAERLISFLKTVIDTNLGFKYIFGGGLTTYMYTLVIASFVGFLVVFIWKCSSSIVKIFKKETPSCFFNLSLASGVFLLSGMVHTEYTIPVLQFVAYGFLIISIILQTIIYHKEKKTPLITYLALVYLIVLAMAVPVVYQSSLPTKEGFAVFESIGSFVAVASYTYLMCVYFAPNFETKKIFNIVPFLLVIGFDLVIIVWRWNDTYELAKDANVFVLIFAILSIVTYVAGLIISKLPIKEGKIDEHSSNK